MTEAKRPKLRLFVNGPLSGDAALELEKNQAHYLRNVMRAQVGDEVAVFNGADGEWRARIEDLGKNRCHLQATDQLRIQEQDSDLWMLFAPLKKGPTDWLVEKATELGVSVLWPVLTRHTVSTRVNTDRLRAHAIEASEQCERLTVPEVREPLDMEMALAQCADRRVFHGDESGGGAPVAEALKGEGNAPHAVLIGPEGGFAQSELDALAQLSFVTPVGLGPRVLRAETAALALLTCRQALSGDWDGTPSFRPHL